MIVQNKFFFVVVVFFPPKLIICFDWQEEQKELDEITAKRQKKGKNEDEAPAEEKTILHGEKLGFFILYEIRIKFIF